MELRRFESYDSQPTICLKNKCWVKVSMGKAKGAGTNATIKITLIDHEGKSSKEKILDKPLHKDFVRGKSDTYTVKVPEDFGNFFRHCFYI